MIGPINIFDTLRQLCEEDMETLNYLNPDRMKYSQLRSNLAKFVENIDFAV